MDSIVYLLNDIVMTAPVQAETIFSKEEDPVIELVWICFSANMASGWLLLLVAAIVSLIVSNELKEKESKIDL